MYFGEYERTVDQKGRLLVPSHLLASNDDVDWSKVMIVKAEPPCLCLYDLQTWRAILAEADVSMDEDEKRLFMHRVLAEAQVSELDNLKRLTIPAPLLNHARVERRCIVVGMLNRLELWEPEVWKSYLTTLDDVELPSISDLSRARIREVS